MLSLIEVKCPHCGARGQLMLPPLGSLIVGPCPECEELVVVFCGCVLPLEKEIMLHGDVEEKRDHLVQVLTGFIEDRVSQMLKNALEERERTEADELDEADEAERHEHEGDLEEIPEDIPELPSTPKNAVISRCEVDDFVRVDLNLIDNRDYFRAIFG
ncbi:MAG TPA: hypothetical protein PLO37_25200 [Candidatus Hydrogenedentes bacterium]|nr:hypothetical protein [Candidatus Hydrogenedentota bacterium]HPG70155.1 hypothetical protein [Candidatus Hydrogenedentota bacterium]